MNPAPIIVFTYKRTDTLEKLIASLLTNGLASETTLYIFSDGSKNDTDVQTVNEVRDYVKTIAGFKQIEYFFADRNLGLAASIIFGVSKVFETADAAIILEDDLIVTRNFLIFMNQALQRYRSEKKAFSVSGYSFNLGNSKGTADDSYFLNRGWSWGWATWKDRWDDIDWLVSDYNEFSNNKKLKAVFNKGGTDLTSMLQKQMTGKLDSWAIRWFYAQFKVAGLTLYPVKSKILNNGFDERATHTTGSKFRYIPLLDDGTATSFTMPAVVKINSFFQKAFQKKMGVRSRIMSKADSMAIRLLRHFKSLISRK